MRRSEKVDKAARRKDAEPFRAQKHGLDRLTQANHGLAARKGQHLDRPVKNHVGNGREPRHRITTFDGERGWINDDYLIPRSANPYRRRVGRNIGACSARNRNLGGSRLARGGKHFDAVHGAVGNEYLYQADKQSLEEITDGKTRERPGFAGALSGRD